MEAEYKQKFDVFPDEVYTAKKLKLPVDKIRMLKQVAFFSGLLSTSSRGRCSAMHTRDALLGLQSNVLAYCARDG